MNGSPVAGLVRGWVDLYTRGLPADERTVRRDEIDDDLWCEHAEAAAAGRSARSLDADLLLRLLFGLPADLSWRLAYRRAPAPASLDGSSSASPRTLGVLAIVAALAWAVMFILFIPLGEAVWLGAYGPVGISGSILAAIAFSAVGIGLARHFQVSLLGAIGAMLVVLGAVTSLGVSIVPLLVGSAILMWDLNRIGVVPRLVPIVDAATAIVFIVALAFGQPDISESGGRALFVALLTPYLLTWIAIGVSLIRGVPQAQVRSG